MNIFTFSMSNALLTPWAISPLNSIGSVIARVLDLLLDSEPEAEAQPPP